MISIEYKDEGRHPELLEIHLTKEDAKDLAADLNSLAEALSDNRSLGYLSKSWGGTDLGDDSIGVGYRNILGLRIYLTD